MDDDPLDFDFQRGTRGPSEGAVPQGSVEW